MIKWFWHHFFSSQVRFVKNFKISNFQHLLVFFCLEHFFIMIRLTEHFIIISSSSSLKVIIQTKNKKQIFNVHFSELFNLCLQIEREETRKVIIKSSVSSLLRTEIILQKLKCLKLIKCKNFPVVQIFMFVWFNIGDLIFIFQYFSFLLCVLHFLTVSASRQR